jgi:hypothetical protein
VLPSPPDKTTGPKSAALPSLILEILLAFHSATTPPFKCIRATPGLICLTTQGSTFWSSRIRERERELYEHPGITSVTEDRKKEVFSSWHSGITSILFYFAFLTNEGRCGG